MLARPKHRSTGRSLPKKQPTADVADFYKIKKKKKKFKQIQTNSFTTISFWIYWRNHDDIQNIRYANIMLPGITAILFVLYEN